MIGLMFIIAGAVFLIIGWLLYHLDKDFFGKDSFTIPGTIKEIVEVEHVSHDATGHVTDKTTSEEPVVTFNHGKTYTFQANIDAGSRQLTVGSKVSVVINRRYPDVARLAEETSSNQTIMVVFASLGVIGIIAGMILLDAQTIMRYLKQPITWLLILGGIGMLVYKCRSFSISLISQSRFQPNIKEIDSNT